ncbi:MAG: hypothetical protein ABIG68_04200, partial [Acidobacteriota bacterium]
MALDYLGGHAQHVRKEKGPGQPDGPFVFAPIVPVGADDPDVGGILQLVPDAEDGIIGILAG